MGSHADRWNAGSRSLPVGSYSHSYHQMPGQPSAFILHSAPKTASRHALSAEIGPAIGVDGLSVDVARSRTAQEPHSCGDIFRPAAGAGDGLMGQVMRGFRLVFRARRADQPGNDAVHGDALGGQVIRQPAGEAADCRLPGHDMGAVLFTGWLP